MGNSMIGNLVFSCNSGSLYKNGNDWFWKSGNDIKQVDVIIEENVILPVNSKLIINDSNKEIDSVSFLYRNDSIENIYKYSIKYDGINFVKYVIHKNKFKLYHS